MHRTASPPAALLQPMSIERFARRASPRWAPARSKSRLQDIGSRAAPPLDGYSILLIVAIGWAWTANVTPARAPGRSAEQAAPFDQQFIDMMVPHHRGAVEMARIAQQRAEHPEVAQMAGAIIADQTREIEQMKSWRQDWYGAASR